MSPKSKAQFAEIRQRTTGTIREAALELFARNGYHSTSISQIAREAGVSKGLMYNYFDSKEALLHEIVMDAVQEGEDLMKQAMFSSTDPYEQLVQIVELSIDWVTSRLHYWKLLTSLAFQTDALKGMESDLQVTQEKTVGQMVDIFQRMGTEKPMEEAFFFGAIMDGMMLHYMQMGDRYPMEVMKNLLLDRYKLKTIEHKKDHHEK